MVLYHTAHDDRGRPIRGAADTLSVATVDPDEILFGVPIVEHGACYQDGEPTLYVIAVATPGEVGSLVPARRAWAIDKAVPALREIDPSDITCYSPAASCGAPRAAPEPTATDPRGKGGAN